MVPEAPLEKTEHGLVPAGEGWFVLNARDARWFESELGLYSQFEGENARFQELGFNIAILRPGEPSSMYHGEDAQEDSFSPASASSLSKGRSGRCAHGTSCTARTGRSTSSSAPATGLAC